MQAASLGAAPSGSNGVKKFGWLGVLVLCAALGLHNGSLNLCLIPQSSS